MATSSLPTVPHPEVGPKWLLSLLLRIPTSFQEPLHRFPGAVQWPESLECQAEGGAVPPSGQFNQDRKGWGRKSRGVLSAHHGMSASASLKAL